MAPRYEICPTRTALLVVDMTNDFLLPGAPQEVAAGREMANALAMLIAECRRAAIPIIYTSHVHRPDGSDMGRMAEAFDYLVDDQRRPVALIEGTEGVEVFDPLRPQPGDVLITKHRYSAFFNTDLDTVLHTKGIDTLLIAGVATNVCSESTARDATFRDYKVIFLSDCNETMDIPDQGWGAMSHEEVNRAVFTTLAAAFCEVASSESVLARIHQAASVSFVTAGS